MTLIGSYIQIRTLITRLKFRIINCQASHVQLSLLKKIRHRIKLYKVSSLKSRGAQGYIKLSNLTRQGREGKRIMARRVSFSYGFASALKQRPFSQMNPQRLLVRHQHSDPNHIRKFRIVYNIFSAITCRIHCLCQSQVKPSQVKDVKAPSAG